MSKKLFSLVLTILIGTSWGCGDGMNGIWKQSKEGNITLGGNMKIGKGESQMLLSRPEESDGMLTSDSQVSKGDPEGLDNQSGKFEGLNESTMKKSPDCEVVDDDIEDFNNRLCEEFMSQVCAIEDDTQDTNVKTTLENLKQSSGLEGNSITYNKQAIKLPQAINHAINQVQISTEDQADQSTLTKTQVNALRSLSDTVRDIAGGPPSYSLDKKSRKILKAGKDALKALLVIFPDEKSVTATQEQKPTKAHKESLQSLLEALEKLFTNKNP